MSIYLYLAPAGAGKTDYLVEQARQVAEELSTIVRVCVPSGIQAQAWKRRLAEAGGALGVRVQLFYELYMECLDSVGQPYIELSEPVQYRLLQAIVDALPLTYYRSLKRRPGFISLLQNLSGELKAGRIAPDSLSAAITQLGNENRLAELAQIYAAYQAQLQARHWTDRPGLGWLAVEALANRPVLPTFAGSVLLVDGFDNFTPVQIDFLQEISQQTRQSVITLTGASGPARPLVYRRFEQTREQLEAALHVSAEPLPVRPRRCHPALAHLEAQLFKSPQDLISGDGAVNLIEAPDRVGEVRSALRWLKKRIIEDGLSPDQVTLLARSITPYRPFITQIGAEFGLPLHLLEGLPLRSNPVVAALLNLLRLMLPASATNPEPALSYRLVLEAWRSPYFDWSARPTLEAEEPIGIEAGDAALLDNVAHQGQVLAGYRQWLDAFEPLARRDQAAQEAGLPDAATAQRLQATFERFVRRLTPPESAASLRDFVNWLEDLIGGDPYFAQRFPQPDPAAAISLKLIDRIRTEPTTAARDLAALQQLKEILRGLVWAEAAITPEQTMTFSEFFDDLAGAIEASSYLLPLDPAEEAILIADVVQAREVSFQAVAVLGLAEGEFPARLTEDPLLRDSDRFRLSQLGIPLQPSTESAEVAFFYETIARPWGQLLLTRPRLADNGVPWHASPYWEEVIKLVKVTPLTLTQESLPRPDQVASWPELMESLSRYSGYAEIREWVAQTQSLRKMAVTAAAQTLAQRLARATGSLFDGDLHTVAADLSRDFAPTRIWSASRLEDYRTCPFLFFVRHLLGVEPRAEPEEGLDNRQLGRIYHAIFEKLYQSVLDPADLDELLEALPGIGGTILDKAPAKEGFRATAWWSQTRQTILDNVQRSLVQLAELSGDFEPLAYEQHFFEPDTPLTLRDGADYFQLHGVIDRVDQGPDQTIRIIDYKTGGSAGYDEAAIREGKKLQLPLYALAAQEALGLGQPVDGFYWHIHQAKASRFRLATFQSELSSGPDAAIQIAVEKAWEVVRGARAGHFTPRPPGDGCPNYCPAASFCWHYRPAWGGQ